MANNDISALSRSRFRGDEWACFDRLPAVLRRALHEGVTDWCALEVRWSLNKRLKGGVAPELAVEMEAMAVRDADAEELAIEARRWPARFGRHPHTAAGASILRYGGARRAA
jgi:hypothetical protein